MDSFVLMGLLGAGSFARVYAAVNKETQEWVAVKVMLKAEIVQKHQIQHIKNEREILCRLDCPFVVAFKGSFQDQERLYIIQEWVQRGDLGAAMQLKGRFSTEEASFYAAEVACALCYLHKRRIIYRDLKPENVLISRKGHIKLADLGFAKVLHDSERTYSLCGSPDYMAPEVTKGAGHSYSADWWSFGIFAYELLFGKVPFHAGSGFQVMANAVSGDVEYPEDCTIEARNLLDGLLQKVPESRLSEPAILSHAFFNGINWRNVKKRMLKPPFLPDIREEWQRETLRTGPAVASNLFLSFG